MESEECRLRDADPGSGIVIFSASEGENGGIPAFMRIFLALANPSKAARNALKGLSRR